jgi:hypothetical protein
VGKRKSSKRTKVKVRTKRRQETVEVVQQVRRQVLTPLEERILAELRVADVPTTAQHNMMTEGTLHVHLYRIRKKYKEARRFVNRIDSLRATNPALRKYLRTRE